MVENLRALGVEAEELEDGMEIQGTDRPLRGRVRSFGDHRIAMAFGVLGALPGNDVEVEGRGAAAVSFPGFWELLSKVSADAGRGGPG
jgi:3-phosphoshikimate 1-carboxyvinyltransferase